MNQCFSGGPKAMPQSSKLTIGDRTQMRIVFCRERFAQHGFPENGDIFSIFLAPRDSNLQLTLSGDEQGSFRLTPDLLVKIRAACW
ncbi:hypothetical protein RRG08_025333 [Elysia crispata]|uniref:Uncharacterized protein n=1 Tax=Elysia crispata TaxID=231223 RepID=A0AAE1A9B5_9GAST|nr:hypothetical protein RRG08_025333 [Elysia crispata]